MLAVQTRLNVLTLTVITCALTLGPVGTGELCSFPTAIHIHIMVFNMLLILWSSWHWSIC